MSSRLRIVGGRLRGRRFEGPVTDGTRATSERVREAIASMLVSRGALEEARVLDLFAGTGALAFEALSRGARSAALVEGSRKAARAAEKAAHDLGLAAEVRVLVQDLTGPPDKVVTALARTLHGPFELVLADPPYRDADRVPPLIDALGREGLLHPETLVVLEHGAKHPPASLGSLASLKHYRYGDTAVLLAAWEGQEP